MNMATATAMEWRMIFSSSMTTVVSREFTGSRCWSPTGADDADDVDSPGASW
jgi:hypothetical protein